MTEPDLKTTLREFKEYVTLSHDSPGKIAADIGVTQPTIWVGSLANANRKPRHWRSFEVISE
jgi:hypothetical protein